MRDEQVVIGVGATGVILQVLHAVTSPGEKMVMTSPTFEGYPIFAHMAGLDPVTVPLDALGHHDLDALADAASDARVVVLCRPHNPTGTLESADEVERFLRRVPSDTVILLDEAYIEFVAPQHRLDGVALVRRFPNVVVLRTFSKAYGLAGLRIGYGFGAPELARSLWTMQPPFGMRHHECSRGRGFLRRGHPTAATYSADYSGAPQPAQAAAGDGHLQHRQPTPTSCTCPRRADPGTRCSTRPVFRSATSRTAACGSRSAHATPPVRC